MDHDKSSFSRRHALGLFGITLASVPLIGTASAQDATAPKQAPLSVDKVIATGFAGTFVEPGGLLSGKARTDIGLLRIPTDNTKPILCYDLQLSDYGTANQRWTVIVFRLPIREIGKHNNNDFIWAGPAKVHTTIGGTVRPDGSVLPVPKVVNTDQDLFLWSLQKLDFNQRYKVTAGVRTYPITGVNNRNQAINAAAKLETDSPELLRDFGDFDLWKKPRPKPGGVGGPVKPDPDNGSTPTDPADPPKDPDKPDKPDPKDPPKKDDPIEILIDECYLTTACTAARGLPDRCHELQTLRAFRDHHMTQVESGRALIQQYYDTAPHIVQAIHQSDHAPRIWSELYQNLVVPTVTAVEQSRFDQAIHIYSAHVHALADRYLK